MIEQTFIGYRNLFIYFLKECFYCIVCVLRFIIRDMCFVFSFCICLDRSFSDALAMLPLLSGAVVWFSEDLYKALIRPFKKLVSE